MSAFTDNSNCHDISNDNDNNNGFNGNEDKQRCAEYHAQLVHEFVNITRENISKRIKELCYIINQNTNIVSLNTHNTHYMDMGHSNVNKIEFKVNTPQFVNIAMGSITPVIQKHTIVQLGACKKIPKSKNEYKKVARNRLNRNKPKFLGNFVFAPLIFDQLYQFCGDIFQDNKMIVFVSILEDILSPTAVVRFEQTRAQPLVPYNTFVMENKFKNSCITLLRYYKLAKQWEIGSKKPNGKKETAKDVWNCLREMCLPKVAERCRNFNNTTPPNNLISSTIQFTTQNPIIPNSPNRDNNHNNIMTNRQNHDGMESKHNDNTSEYQSMDDNSTQMSISTHPQQQQQQQQSMYPSMHYGDNLNSNSSARCTVPFSYHLDNNNNNNNTPHQPPLNLQDNYSYPSTHSLSYNRTTPRSSMYSNSSRMNSSGVPSPVSSQFSSTRNSIIGSNNDVPPPVPTPNTFNTFGSQTNQVMHTINNNNGNTHNNNNGNELANVPLNSFCVMPNDNHDVNDYGGHGIMNSMNNTNNMIPNTNNDNTYGYNNDNNTFSRNNTNDHLQINNNNNYGHITNNVYHQYNINQNHNDDRDNYQNCDNMTTSSNNSSNSSTSDNTANSLNPSIENENDNNTNNQIINTLALPNILQMETSGDFMMNSPMTMNQNHPFSISSPLPTNNGIDMMIMSPMTNNNNNNGGFNNQQTNWIPNIENTDFDYSNSTQINSSFATFQ